jgi:DNA-binding protein YbaB
VARQRQLGECLPQSVAAGGNHHDVRAPGVAVGPLPVLETQAGGGAVKVVARCDQSLASIHILPDAVNPQDVPFLEDLILTAVNQALRQAKEISEKEMGSVTSGLSLPGLM